MLYRIQFRIALREVLLSMKGREDRFYKVSEILEEYLKQYPTDKDKTYIKNNLKKRIKTGCLCFEELNIVESKMEYNEVYKHNYYLFKVL